MKKLISLMIALMLAVGMSVSAYADSFCSVDYGNAAGFVFNPDDGDLFQNFKGLVPGDEKSQYIVLKNTCADKAITMYLRAEVNQKYKAFLDYITIAVYQIKGKQTVLLAQNIASEAGNLANPTMLGKYQPKEQGQIIVMIYIDPAMNNDFADASGVIKWIFTAEESDPEKTTKEQTTGGGKIPFTGSELKKTVLALSTIGVAVVVAVVCVFADKKKKKAAFEENNEE